MTPWQTFVDEVDDSHTMTTSKKHLALLCAAVQGQAWNILELGSHVGISAAAMALAAPAAKVTAVDLCDTVPEAARVAYWAALGVGNITPVAGSAADFLSTCYPGQYSFIFHDAVHGPAAFLEYLGCCEIASGLAIHDYELLPHEMQQAVESKFRLRSLDSDERGRVLFMGWK